MQQNETVTYETTVSYPAFDTAKPTDAERIAALEKQVDNLTRLVETLTDRVNPLEQVIYGGGYNLPRSMTRARLDNFTE